MRHPFDFNPGYRWSVKCNAWIPGKAPIAAAYDARQELTSAMLSFGDRMGEEWLKMKSR